MFIHARRGLPFSVDVQTLFDSNPTSLNGTALSWLGPHGFAPALKALDHDEGLVRYTATAEETFTWPAGTHATTFRYRAAINGNLVTEIIVYLQVHEENDVINLPDLHDHFGYLGTVGVADEFSFIFNGSADTGVGGVGDNGWSPLFAIEDDGDRRVLKLVGWTGGSGANPGYVGYYVGAITFEADIADGVDIRGPQGLPGVDGEDGVGSTADSFQTVLVNGVTSLVADSPTDILSINATTGISLSGNATTDTLTINNTGVTSATAGAGVTVSPSTGAVVVTNTGVLTVNGAAGAVTTPNLFGTVVVPGPLSLVADSTNDTLTLATGAGIAISGNTGTDTATFTNTGVLSVNGATGAVNTPNMFQTVVANGTSLVPDATLDTLTINQGTGITVTGNAGADSVTIGNAGVLTVNGASGAVTTPNLFGTVSANGTLLVADTTSDTLNVIPGNSGIGVTGTVGTDTLIISNTGVTTLAANAPLAVNAATGPVTVSTTLIQPYSYTRGPVSATNSTTTPLAWGPSVVVPAGKSAHFRYQVLATTAAGSTGITTGFRLQQGGTPTEGAVSYGCHNYRIHHTDVDITSTVNSFILGEGFVGVNLGGDIYVPADGLVAIPGRVVGNIHEMFIKNTAATTLTVSGYFHSEVGGSLVTLLAGSSFFAHTTV